MFMPMFQQLSMAFKELEDDQDMVTPAQVGAIFVDWTDPQKAMYVIWYPNSSRCSSSNLDRDIHGQPADDMIHVDLASDIVKALYNQEMSSAKFP